MDDLLVWYVPGGANIFWENPYPLKLINAVKYTSVVVREVCQSFAMGIVAEAEIIRYRTSCTFFPIERL